MARYIKKEFKGYSLSWTAPAGVTSINFTIYDSFDSLVISTGQQSTALKRNGSAWAWGQGTSGQLGDNTITNKSSPVPVVGGHSFVQLNGGVNHTAALKADGSAWAWGLNTSGQLGDNSVLVKSSPVAVVGGHSFIQAFAGTTHSIALKADGSAWTWGSNTDGQLGDSGLTGKSSPVPVVGGHSFIQVNAGNNNTALKADGSVWSWGSGSGYGLGDNTLIPKSSPVPVVGGQLFQANSNFINEATIQVIPGTTYNMNFFLTQVGTQILRNYNGRNNIRIVLEYYA